MSLAIRACPPSNYVPFRALASYEPVLLLLAGLIPCRRLYHTRTSWHDLRNKPNRDTTYECGACRGDLVCCLGRDTTYEFGACRGDLVTLLSAIRRLAQVVTRLAQSGAYFRDLVCCVASIY